MNVTREQVANALLGMFTGNGNFNLTSRKFQMWDAVDKGNQPALFVKTGNTRVAQSNAFGKSVYRMGMTIFLYCQHSPDSGTVPGTLINNLIDVVDAALYPSPVTGYQNLGVNGITHTYIEGSIFVNEGDAPQDTQSIAVIPITVLVGA
jgi:hypothetical protein